MVYNGPQEVVHGVVGSDVLLKLVSRTCIHQPRWPTPLERRKQATISN